MIAWVVSKPSAPYPLVQGHTRRTSEIWKKQTTWLLAISAWFADLLNKTSYNALTLRASFKIFVSIARTSYLLAAAQSRARSRVRRNRADIVASLQSSCQAYEHETVGRVKAAVNFDHHTLIVITVSVIDVRVNSFVLVHDALVERGCSR